MAGIRETRAVRLPCGPALRAAVTATVPRASHPAGGRAWASLHASYGSAVRRDLRSPTTPAVTSSNPAARGASHGADSEMVSCSAVPPRPVAAPPIGAVWLPAASVRLSTSSPEGPSRTTMVWTEPAARVTDLAVCSPGALNCTVCVPGRMARYDVTEPKG